MTTKEIKSLQLQTEYQLYNIGAERTFVAALMARPEWIEKASAEIPSDWLNMASFRSIYEQIKQMAYTAAVQGWKPRKINVDTLGQYAQSQSNCREYESHIDVIKIAQTLAESPTFAPEEDMGQTVRYLQIAAAQVAIYRAACSAQSKTTDGIDPARNIAEFQNELANIAAGSSNAGIQAVGSGTLTAHSQGFKPTHLPQLSGLLGGYQPGLHIVVARTNVGKSVFMSSIALDAAVNQRIPVLYLDCEMGKEKLLKRAIAWQLQEDQNPLFAAYDTDPAARKRIEDAQQIINGSPIFFADIGTSGIDQIAGYVRQFQRSYLSAGQKGLIFLDYIRAGVAGPIPEWKILDEMTVQLRNLSVEVGLPLIAGIQANKAAIGMDQAAYSNAGIGTIAGSDRISHHADSVMTLRNLDQNELERVGKRAKVQHDGNHEINGYHFNQVAHLNKNRDGATWESGIPLRHVRGQFRYVELPIADMAAIHASPKASKLGIGRTAAIAK